VSHELCGLPLGRPAGRPEVGRKSIANTARKNTQRRRRRPASRWRMQQDGPAAQYGAARRSLFAFLSLAPALCSSRAELTYAAGGERDANCDGHRHGHAAAGSHNNGRQGRRSVSVALPRGRPRGSLFELRRANWLAARRPEAGRLRAAQG